MDEYLQQEQDDAFFQAMRELGEALEAEAAGKPTMINPAAMKKLTAITRFFKKLKAEDDEGERNITVDYFTDPLLTGDASVIIGVNSFGLSKGSYLDFFKLLEENCDVFGIFPSNKEDRITMDFCIRNFFVRYENDQ